MNFSQRIGECITTARLRRNLSQSDLARALNKPRQHISQIERGKQQPRAELLVEIANVLGVTTDYLLGREDEIRPELAAVAA